MVPINRSHDAGDFTLRILEYGPTESDENIYSWELVVNNQVGEDLGLRVDASCRSGYLPWSGRQEPIALSDKEAQIPPFEARGWRMTCPREHGRMHVITVTVLPDGERQTSEIHFYADSPN
ncbi:hypothetical protein GCM10007147_44860 [Nocardiopsis kunsanensis]|uniref:Uncharacterized protein n=1 Tax=Nocardiopsis kunsanensis TaxID=141693 RepID=A0A919CMX8_9ACTN|nr:hypothetical protein GCM10007147_44860 [Nocardiopsis kunsanensis]